MKNTCHLSSITAKALVRTAMQESSAEGYAQTCEMIAVTPSANFDNITVKTLIIAGKHDQISSVAAANTIAGASRVLPMKIDAAADRKLRRLPHEGRKCRRQGG